MKELIVTLVIGVALFTTVACSPVPKSDAADKRGQDVEASAAETKANAPDDGMVTEETAEFGASLFGRVKSIVGNEIELEIAKAPFGMEPGNGAVTGKSSGTNGEVREFVYESTIDPDGVGEIESGDGVSSQSQVVIAMEGEDGQVHIIGEPGGENMNLEYTGESKSIIIPAGVAIMNMLGGEGTLNDIKKGSVLMVGVDDENAIAPTVLNIVVME